MALAEKLARGALAYSRKLAFAAWVAGMIALVALPQMAKEAAPDDKAPAPGSASGVWGKEEIRRLNATADRVEAFCRSAAGHGHCVQERARAYAESFGWELVGSDMAVHEPIRGEQDERMAFVTPLTGRRSASQVGIGASLAGVFARSKWVARPVAWAFPRERETKWLANLVANFAPVVGAIVLEHDEQLTPRDARILSAGSNGRAANLDLASSAALLARKRAGLAPRGGSIESALVRKAAGVHEGLHSDLLDSGVEAITLVTHTPADAGRIGEAALRSVNNLVAGLPHGTRVYVHGDWNLAVTGAELGACLGLLAAPYPLLVIAEGRRTTQGGCKWLRAAAVEAVVSVVGLVAWGWSCSQLLALAVVEGWPRLGREHRVVGCTASASRIAFIGALNAPLAILVAGFGSAFRVGGA